MISAISLNPVIEKPKDFEVYIDYQQNCLSLLTEDKALNKRVASITPLVSNMEINSFAKDYIKKLKGSSTIITSGSIPPNLPKTIYRDMVKIAKDNNVRVMIDVSDDYLSEAIKAKPFMIKIELEKLEEIVGYKLLNEEMIINESKYICMQGVDVVAISLGAAGAIFTTKEGTYRVYGPKAKGLKTKGWAEGFLLGFALALFSKGCLVKAFKYAVAAATTAMIRGKNGTIEVSNVEKLSNYMTIEKLE